MLNADCPIKAESLAQLPGACRAEQGAMGERIGEEGLHETIRLMAMKVYGSLPKPSAVEFSDLLQAGNVGLLQAKKSYDATSGVPLGAYARFRIRGEMLDAVHRASPLGRYPRKGDSGRTVRTIPMDEWTENETFAKREPLAETQVSKLQHRRLLADALNRLPARGRRVLRLKYAEEFTLREIGSMMQVNESRACQIHREALAHLRQTLGRKGVSNLIWRD